MRRPTTATKDRLRHMIDTLVAAASAAEPVYTREDMTRWVGAIVAFVGAVIVSPSAVEVAASEARERIRGAARTVYSQLARTPGRSQSSALASCSVASRSSSRAFTNSSTGPA